MYLASYRNCLTYGIYYNMILIMENKIQNDTEIIFLIEESQNGGYEAKGLGYSIYTQGDTKDELIASIKDALKCHFDNEGDIPRIIRLHYVRDEVVQYA